MSLTESPAWSALIQSCRRHEKKALARTLCRRSLKRAAAFSQSTTLGLKLDYSKNLIETQTLEAIVKILAHQQDLSNWIQDMFAGEKINQTEYRGRIYIPH